MTQRDGSERITVRLRRDEVAILDELVERCKDIRPRLYEYGRGWRWSRAHVIRFALRELNRQTPPCRASADVSPGESADE